MQYYLQAGKIWRKLGDRRGMALERNNIGVIYQTRGKYGEALQYHLQAEKIDRELGDKK